MLGIDDMESDEILEIHLKFEIMCVSCETCLSNERVNEMLVLSLVICVGICQYV
jgi:hypothetical protein